MTKDEIQTLYKQYIIPESKDAFHFSKPERYDEEILAYNPLCGDKYHIYQVKNPQETHFHGMGCALSQASASLMARSLHGLREDLQKKLLTAFLRSLDLNQEINNELPESLKVLASLKYFEGRMDCIKLPWQALFDSLIKQ